MNEWLDLCLPPLIETYHKGAACLPCAQLYSSVFSLLQKPANVRVEAIGLAYSRSHLYGCCRPASGHAVRGVSERGPAINQRPRHIIDYRHCFFLLFSGISHGLCNNWHYLGHVKHEDDDDDDDDDEIHN